MSVRLRYVTRLVRGSGFPHDRQGLVDAELPFFKVGDLSAPGNDVFLETCSNWVTRETASTLGAEPVPAGSVLLPKIGAALLGGVRRITTRESVFDNNVLGVVPTGIDRRYLRYWLGTVDLGRLANPGPIPSLDDDAFRDLPVPRPLPHEQQVIADYLDVETSRVDGLIRKKRRMIEVLEERWQSTMAAGVSGELLRLSLGSPSGIPWLPILPVGWRGAKLNLVARLGSGHTPSRQHPEWWEDATIPWITTGEVPQVRDDRKEYLSETREEISEIGLAHSAAQLHPAGTVVLCRTASAGYSAIMGVDMATSQDFVTWTCGSLLRPRFLLLCLRVMRRDLLGRLAMGSTHKTIYMPDIESIAIPLPTVEIQDAVVHAVYSRLAAIDGSIDLLIRQSKLLAEHRQALITAAVTGEIDIPGAAA